MSKKVEKQTASIKDVKDWEVDEIFNESGSVDNMDELLAEEEAQYDKEEKG